jgi:hypothetical protein
MNEIVKSIPMFFFGRDPVQVPQRIDITAIAMNKTSQQFERAFIEVTGYGKETERANNQHQ